MTEHYLKSSPQVYARVGGFAYLFIILSGAFGEMFVRGTIVVSGDALTTANNILANPLLWRIGIAGDLLMHVCDAVVMMSLYVLLKPVNKNLALLAMLFNLIQTSVLVANKLNLIMPLVLLGGTDYLKVFDPQQLQALSYLFLKVHGYGFGIGLIFFGFECLILGYLIFTSGFFPKAIGILIQVAGVCYLINSFALILAPNFSNLSLLIPSFVAEFSFCLWLIFKGVNVSKWREKERYAGTNI